MITSTSIFKTAGLVHLPLGVNICLYFYRTYSTCSAELVTFSCSYTTCWATLVTFRSLFFQIYTACWATLNNSRPCDSRVWPVHSWFHLVFAATFFALSLPAFFCHFCHSCVFAAYIFYVYILQRYLQAGGTIKKIRNGGCRSAYICVSASNENPGSPVRKS